MKNTSNRNSLMIKKIQTFTFHVIIPNLLTQQYFDFLQATKIVSLSKTRVKNKFFYAKNDIKCINRLVVKHLYWLIVVFCAMINCYE